MKKKTVKLISAAASLGVLCGVYAGVSAYVTSQEKKEEQEEESIDIWSADTESIISVAFTAEQDGAEFEKQDDVWSEKSDKNFPVDQDAVDSAVNNLASLTADQEITNVEDLSQYDLDAPQNTIVLKTDDGESALDIGMESSGKYYVKKAEDDSTVYLVSGSCIDSFMGNLYDFAESGTFPSVTSATITDVTVEKEDGYTLSQDPDDLFWSVSDGTNSEKADTTKAGNVTSAIGSLSYDGFVDYNCTDDSEYGFDDPYAVITVKYTEEETVEEDEDITEEESTDSETAEAETTDEESAETEDDEDEVSEEEEPETVTVEKEMTICVGDETENGRFVKVDDSKEVYTISEDSLEEITGSTMSDFYSMTVNYTALSDLKSLEIQSEDGRHEVSVTTETTIDEEDEDAEETTVTVYKLDGEEIDSSAFTTFYNKLNNLTAQERLEEEYDPEEEPAYTFVYEKTDGEQITAEYYAYDTNFYAAVVDEKVYLINKMNIRDLEEAYEAMTAPEESEE